jgi:site-specific DNA-methyltransferase (adenine-specific)
VVDADLVIIAGHTRYHAAKQLGLETVPVHVAVDLTPDQVQAYRLADNKLSELAEWDEAGLAKELQAISETDIDLTLLGFDAGDFAKALLASEEKETIELPMGDEDDCPEPPTEPITKAGDVYQLGKHKLICGDSTSMDSYRKLLGAEMVDMVLTDPPYNVAYEGKAGKIKNDSMSGDDFKQFLLSFYWCCHKVARAGCPIYVWFSEAEGLSFRQTLIKAGWMLKQTLIWVKNAFVMGRMDYHQKHEPCLYGWKGGAEHTFLGGRTQNTVWTFDKPQRSNEHPTMKPVKLFEESIKNSCQLDGIVLDPFGGSGTTIIACQNLGRQARVIELDPKFCDVIVKRFKTLYPKQDILLNGTPFNVQK